MWENFSTVLLKTDMTGIKNNIVISGIKYIVAWLGVANISPNVDPIIIKLRVVVIVMIKNGTIYIELILSIEKITIFDITDIIVTGNSFPIRNSIGLTEDSISTSRVFFSFSSQMEFTGSVILGNKTLVSIQKFIMKAMNLVLVSFLKRLA